MFDSNRFEALPSASFMLFLALGLTGCGTAKADAPSASPSPQHVETIAARRGSVGPTLQISGVIAPMRQIGIGSALNEPVVGIGVREGQRVRAGQMLARLQTDDLDSELVAAQETAAEALARLQQQRAQSSLNVGQYANQIETARAAYAQAQAAYAGAQADRARYLGLYEHGYLAEQVLAQQNVTVVQDRQAVDAARAQYEQMRKTAGANLGTGGLEGLQIAAAQRAYAAAQATVAQLQRGIARATIVSPSDGVIVAINANVGEYPAGRQLFTIDDDRVKYAILSASSAEALRVREGAPASVSVPDGTVRAPGRVEALLDQVAPGSTNFTVKVRVNGGPAALRPGMPIVATIRLPRVDGTVVPISAFTDPMRTSVFIVRDGKAHQQNVNDDAEDGVNAVVRGLPPDAHVVKDGQGGVGDGDPLSV